jgi:hypothetical protein
MDQQLCHACGLTVPIGGFCGSCGTALPPAPLGHRERDRTAVHRALAGIATCVVLAGGGVIAHHLTHSSSAVASVLTPAQVDRQNGAGLGAKLVDKLRPSLGTYNDLTADAWQGAIVDGCAGIGRGLWPSNNARAKVVALACGDAASRELTK